MKGDKKATFKFDYQGRKITIEGPDLELVITFKTDRYNKIVSKRRRLAMEYDLMDLFRAASYENQGFRESLDQLFGALSMRDIPPERWKDQADYLL